ncbi:GGDEF domain-containing phosphodiesterase [Jannaschia sp. S6380]|uniref:bifunctional diguanylate cyclase/phosphodiesterase n=1 Tax=Jannaschia sp. S6380 TaxID=2926408 RepID=UPI001FF430B6|nr:GGDEF domain-containing phosphodiesterase [Jannaschia sp. S6380]MCK0169150.1 GGDEF domain-containing phosphodiesterase [Jannaschia sp. S6380]
MPDIAATLLLTGIAALGGWLIGRGKMVVRSARPPELRPVAPPTGGEGTLALLDVDDLKGVNSARDFDTGDRLLNAVGDVLRRTLPAGGGMERLESGRFLIWLPETDLTRACETVERMRALASVAVVESMSGTVSRSLSAGVVTAVPDEGRSRAILRADATLARAKALGGNRMEVTRALPVPSLAPPRAEIEAAIAARALEFHVQPIFDLRDGRAAGVEALLRWNRPDGAILGPAGFLDTLKRIPEAGADLFPDLAVEAAAPFVTGTAPIYATFNVTGTMLDGRGSAGYRWLSQILDRLPPDRLVLEIVETAVIVRSDRAIERIEKLRAQGVRIALDDFGTGLSNLERLRRLPVDIVKVDRVFVDGLGRGGREEAILSSLVALAQGLNIDLVAEGVETQLQADTLRGLGIHFGQGFHLGRPAPAADWASRIAAPPSA